MPPASIPPLTTAIASVNLDRIIRKLPCSSSAVVRFVSTLKRRSSDASKTHRQTLILAISIPIGICILVLVAVTFWLLRSHTRRHGEGWAATSPITAERRSIRPPVFSDAASPPTPSPSRIFDGSALWTHRKITFLYPHPRIQLQGTMFSEEPRIPIVTPHGAPESSIPLSRRNLERQESYFVNQEYPTLPPLPILPPLPTLSPFPIQSPTPGPSSTHTLNSTKAVRNLRQDFITSTSTRTPTPPASPLHSPSVTSPMLPPVNTTTRRPSPALSSPNDLADSPAGTLWVHALQLLRARVQSDEEEVDSSGRRTALGQLEGYECADLARRRDEATKSDLEGAMTAIRDGRLLTPMQALLVHQEITETGVLNTPLESSYANQNVPPSPHEATPGPAYTGFDWRRGEFGFTYPSDLDDGSSSELTDDSSSEESTSSSEEEEEEVRSIDAPMRVPASTISDPLPGKTTVAIHLSMRPASDTALVR